MNDNAKLWLYRAFNTILLVALFGMQYVVLKEISATKTATEIVAEG